MSYPNAYCVKCGKHTDTQQKHTVLLQNNARALKGVCPSCASSVYKILPKGKAYLTKVPLTAEEQKRYPDAFCVKCQEHTPTANAHTVIFENASRAVTGSCQKCGSEVYRILSPKEKAKVEATPANAPAAAAQGERRLSLVRRIEEPRYAVSAGRQWSYVVAAGLIMGIVAAFCAYSFL